MPSINDILTARDDCAQHHLHVERDGEIESFTLAQVAGMARIVSARLAELGIGAGDRVGISARNSLAALVLDLAIVNLRGVTAGIEAGAQRIDPLEAKARFGLAAFFVEDPAAPDLLPISLVGEWIDAARPPNEPASKPAPYDADDIVAIKFTSGSTGPPKGLEARAGSINASLEAVQSMFGHGPGDNVLVFLPQNLLQQRYWVYSAFLFGHDISLIHVDRVDDVSRIADMSCRTKASVIMGVPAFYEGLMKQVLSDSRHSTAGSYGEHLREVLGPCIRYLWTGSAPISRKALDFFNDAGLPLCEGYGLNETCIVAKNYPGAMKIGSVGKVLPHKSVRFDPDGVIIVGASEPVNKAYTWCQPGDNEKLFRPNAEVYTNDVGYIDDEGYLYVLGRKDDILVLTSGFNILPGPIQSKLGAHSAIRHLLLFGHQRPYLTAVIDYDPERATQADIRAHIDAVNMTLLPEQRAGAVVFAEAPFSLEAGTLGNQGKPVRRVIETLLQDALNSVSSTDQSPMEPA